MLFIIGMMGLVQKQTTLNLPAFDKKQLGYDRLPSVIRRLPSSVSFNPYRIMKPALFFVK